jgi:hypothetical protein
MSSHIGMLIESAVTSALAFMIRGFFYGLGGGLALLIVYKLGGL